MKIENSHINELRTEILSEYNNTQYLRISKEHSFDNIRGTKLWNLWCGINDIGINVRDLDRIIKQSNDDEHVIQLLTDLRDSLKHEFEKIYQTQKGKV